MGKLTIGHVTPLSFPALRTDYFGRMEAEMDRLFNEFLSPRSAQRAKGDHYPKTDVFREGEDLHFHAALPFVKKDDVKIELKDNILTISGQAEAVNEEEGVEYYTRELRHSSFSRSWELPATAKQSEIVAKYEDGILKIAVKKVFAELEEKKPKLIEIQ